MSKTEQMSIFYEILQDLEDKLGGRRFLSNCNGSMQWPRQGVYFFFESGEKRSSGSELRVVRVGTHALKRNSKTTLWDRLRMHRGTIGGKRSGGGDHRASIFRFHVGSAILRKQRLEKEYPTWGKGSSAHTEIKDKEYPIERMVSQYIRKMPFLWLKIEDSPGPNSKRAYIERNSIILLSNYGEIDTLKTIDPPSKEWLGFYCTNKKVNQSGLWNVNHVTSKKLDPEFLPTLEREVASL